VSLFATGAAVGVPGPSNAPGRVILYTRTGTSWAETGTITAPGAANGDRFGSSVSRAGALVIAGAPQANSGGGKTRVFSNTTFIENLLATDNAAGDNLGAAIGFDAGRAVAGAPGQDAGASNGGEGYVYEVVTSTAISIDSDDPDPSNAGAAYTVNVTVTPTPAPVGGTVEVSDGDGATCSIVLDVGGQGNCQLTSLAPGSKTLTASFLGTATFSASTIQEDHEVIGGDLAVSIDDGTDKIVAGETKVYNIVVSNPGDFAAVGVEVINNMPAELNPGTATWTCTAGVGGTCPAPANGTGNIDQLVDLLPGGSVTFAVTVSVVDPLDPNVVLFVDNTASIVPGLNADLNPANNTFTDTDDTATNDVFSDGFEGDPPPP
jgi:uncharacterized repeat protein (TIGR01451 family)